MSAPRPRLIVNADDFGLSPGVNRGILEAFERGILTSTTALVNLEHFADAAAEARRLPALPVGVHLTLLWGRPVSEPSSVPSLVDRQGSFPTGLGTLAARALTGRLAAREIEAEFRAQVRRFLDAGLVPTHVDTHKHVHCLPVVFEALLAVAQEFGVERVRLPVERGFPEPGGVGVSSSLRRLIARVGCRGARARLERRGVRTTDHFVGLGVGARLNQGALLFILDHLQAGTTELMCHPGHPDEASRRWSRRPLDRLEELSALTDSAVRSAARDVELVSFRDL